MTTTNEPADNPDSSDQTQPPACGKKRWFALGVLVIVVAAGGYLVKGSGIKSRVMCKIVPGYWQRMSGPEVVGSTPTDGDAGLAINAPLILNLKNPNGSLDPATITPASLVLIRTCDQTPTPVKSSIQNDGAKLIVTPASPLRPRTQYTLLLTNAIKDDFAKELRPFEVSFTTAGKSDPALRFTKIALPTAAGAGFTACVMSPFPGDRTLYAASDDGRIFKFPILADGTLAPPKVYDSLVKFEKAPRILTGFCFDPASTPDNPILWVSHSWGSFTNVPDFSGKISRISGHDLETVQDVVIHLPRSVKDHMNNQPSIGPDGALYWSQPSNSAFGDPDPIWGMRAEHLLNATILRLDIQHWTPGHVIDAKTKDAGGTYDPLAAGAPLTIYAYGVRLGYDLLWHSNGHLYVAVNGSAAGGNTPAHGNLKALKDIPLDEDDWLFSIQKGKFYGHPNPVYHRYVLNGGNPTAGYDFAEMPLYPVGTQPEADWRRATYVFGRHTSPDGMLEYKDVSFGGKLDKTIMVCRYNFGGDILVLHLNQSGGVDSDDCTIPGLGNLTNPLDITEDKTNGNLYVSEYGAQRISLLRPSPAK
jgi:glucose/arabinose dehydrogenase